MSYIITFINEKGGVGKSSVCFSTAWKLANIGQKVLLIDLDGQKANISFSPEFTKTVILLWQIFSRIILTLTPQSLT